MFAIGIRYLCGRAVATHPADRGSPEWPPHPDRVFMALAAAFFETGETTEERAALEWLEGLAPPALFASEAHHRTITTSYVPVNDDSNPVNEKKKKPHMVSGTLPIGRGRQARSFPTVIPESDTFYLIWGEAELVSEHRSALESLCNKATYLGHSSSPVQMWLEAAPPDPNLTPVNGRAPHRLRVTGRGRLAVLAANFQADQRPSPSLWSGYAPPVVEMQEDPIPQTIFDPNLIVFRRVNGQELPLESTLALTEALRGAVMVAVPQPPPEWVSGHRADGTRSEQDHLAFVPLPHVGREHADGHLLGVALAVPRQISEAEVARCLAPLLASDETYEPRVTRLTMGRIGEWEIMPEEREQPPMALNPKTWTRPSKRWATVTPIVLDRYPKKNDETEAQEAISAACARIGLPRPVDVLTMPMSLFIGAPRVNSFAPMQTKTGARRWHTHALLTFAEPVRGPVLVGAGRYRGYGLCRPYSGLQGDGA
jgi:CRISPR-associated protein Csb2